MGAGRKGKGLLGGTASKKKSVTEAGQMSSWLKKQGIPKSRILVEKASRTTAGNAKLSLELLQQKHPEIKYLAIVSGDYHVKVGVLLFEAAAILRTEPGAEPPVQVVGWAGCKTSNDQLSAQFRCPPSSGPGASWIWWGTRTPPPSSISTSII